MRLPPLLRPGLRGEAGPVRRDSPPDPAPRPGSASGALLPVLLALLALSAAAAGPLRAQETEAPRADASAAAVDPAPFAVRYRGHVSRLRVNPLFVLPGERVTVEALAPGRPPAAPGNGSDAAGPAGGELPPLELRATGGRTERLGEGRWAWTAPREHGDHRLTLSRRGATAGSRETEDGVAFSAFVLVPGSEVRDGELNGYRIGEYPSSSFRGLARYRPPDGFVEVTRENRDLLLSPHFRLGDFLCKQTAGWPRYVVVKERLLWKLEAVAAELRRRHGASRLHVMSGYRTPHYNRAIGQASRSRHMYGDAADVFVDESPRDGRMDDLNGDGRSTRADARALYRLADRLSRRSLAGRLAGGLGAYSSTATHGPFVHVDARGYRARW